MSITATGLQTSQFYPARFAAWQRRGLSARAASAVALMGCETVEEISRLGREYFEGRPNLGLKSLIELEALAGWPPKRQTAVDVVAAALQLAITDRDEAREAATDALIALRRSGFVISTRIA